MANPRQWRLHSDFENPLFAEYVTLCHDVGWFSLYDAKNVSPVGPNDALIVVDLQNDFVPLDAQNKGGGRFSVPEGADIVPLVVRLMEHFSKNGGHIVATRDYHPKNHCSFMPTGPFPEHCIQGNVGSYFYHPIGASLSSLRRNDPNVQVVFKGFHEDVDSFGAFRYPDCAETFERLSRGNQNPERLHGCSHAAWTGSVSLDCSNLDRDINAPPDVLASRRAVDLSTYLRNKNVNRVFVVGLALDFCVLDTCLNAAEAGFSNVSMIFDACRAAHLPPLGVAGSGFIQDPAALLVKMKRRGVKVRPCAAICPTFDVKNPIKPAPAPGRVPRSCFFIRCLKRAGASTSLRSDSHRAFPQSLGPFALVPAQQLALRLYQTRLEWEALTPIANIAVFKSLGMACSGKTSPIMPVTLDVVSKRKAGIPEEAHEFLWCYPVSNVHSQLDPGQVAYFATTTPTCAFFVYGGFLYLKKDRTTCGMLAIAPGEGLVMGPPHKLESGCALALQDRWQTVTLQTLSDAGAKLFTWICPGEIVSVKTNKSYAVGGKHGAFAYLFHTDVGTHDQRDVFFQVVSSCTGCSPNGRLDIAEKLIVQKPTLSDPALSAKDKIAGLFKDWDMDSDGLIIQEQMVRSVQRLHPGLSEESVLQLLEESGAKENGRVNFLKFMNWFLNMKKGVSE